MDPKARKRRPAPAAQLPIRADLRGRDLTFIDPLPLPIKGITKLVGISRP
jgi:hypothetical protein